MKKLQDIVKEKIVILDGAMGTVIQGYGLTEADFRGERFKNAVGQTKGNNDMLNITRPDVLLDIHRRYLKAGADIIETNTFSSQRISQSDYHLENEAREMALAGARLARQAADEFSTAEWPRFVAGSVGPTNKTLSMSADVTNPASRELTYDELWNDYVEQIDGLVEGGVDAILIETIFDSLNAKCAVDAAMHVMEQRGKELPIMMSISVSDLAGRTLSGQTLDAFLGSISSYPIFSVGLNCSFGAQEMRPFLEDLARKAPYYISAYPNAGMPNAMGNYDETAESMSPLIGQWMEDGLVNIVGGCCGTDETFIHQYYLLSQGKKPHVPQPKPTTLWLSGLELLDVNSDVRFVNVGERCNVAGSRKFLRLIKEKNYEEALSIARKQVEDGALVIDVNMDDALLDAKEEMVNFLNLIASEPDISKVPVMIDSSKWDVVTAGLKCLQGKCIVNSISLKEGEEVFLSHARDIKMMGAAVVVMAFDENGQADTYERKIAVCERSYHLLVDKVGIAPQDIIFDPNVLSVATGIPEHNLYALDFIRATEWIKNNLTGAHVSGGVSNLSFSFRGNNWIREAMHAVFLFHAQQKGMDFGIVNSSAKVMYSDIPAEKLQIIEDALLRPTQENADSLISLAQDITEQTVDVIEKSDTESFKKPVEERLIEALTKGNSRNLEADLQEALAKYEFAVKVIEGPLMDGMNNVGRLFGEGKMFLPQVVKAARCMKQAVTFLQPYIEQQKVNSMASAGKVLLATVKGDVHDIGKNIVSVVMACNGYEIIDLGVMVPAEEIVRKTLELKPDIIGLSGLITPSLDEMIKVVKLLKESHVSVPVMIGGATTSPLHTALRIAPQYDGSVIWVKDASQNAPLAAKFINPVTREEAKDSLQKEQQDLCKNESPAEILSFEEAKKRKPDLFKGNAHLL